MIRWRGREERRGEQVANARDSFIDLTPASEAAATATRDNWSALLPGQPIPLIWEETRRGRQERDECRERGWRR